MAAGTVSVATLVRAELTLLAEMTTLEAREKELSTSSALRGLIEPGADVARRWETAPISTRREIARILLTPSWSDSYGSSPYPDTAGDAAHRPTNTPSGGEDDVERLVIPAPVPGLRSVELAYPGGERGPPGQLDTQDWSGWVFAVSDGTATVRERGDLNAGVAGPAAAGLAPLGLI